MPLAPLSHLEQHQPAFDDTLDHRQGNAVDLVPVAGDGGDDSLHFCEAVDQPLDIAHVGQRLEFAAGVIGYRDDIKFEPPLRDPPNLFREPSSPDVRTCARKVGQQRVVPDDVDPRVHSPH